MTSRWNHSICDDCWKKRCEEKDEVGREPVRLRNPSEEKCCSCEREHSSGIVVREDPALLKCGGLHE